MVVEEVSEESNVLVLDESEDEAEVVDVVEIVDDEELSLDLKKDNEKK